MFMSQANHIEHTVALIGSLMSFSIYDVFRSNQPQTSIYFEIQQPLPQADRTVALFNDKRLTNTITTRMRLSLVFQEAYLEFNVTNHGFLHQLLEVSIDGVPLAWSKTPPPAGSSSTVFDISTYLSLLNKKTNVAVSVTVLDGLATADVSLALKVIKRKEKPLVDYFNSDKSASRVQSLPLSRQWTNQLPRLSANTTVAHLNLFIAATGSEGVHYKQANPVRYVNVFIDNLYAGTVTVKPSLLNMEQISRAPSAAKSFRPVVTHGQFTGFIYTLDLVPFLPLLWKNGHVLSIRVASPFDTVPMKETHPITRNQNAGVVDANWVVSASLLLWEVPEVVSSVGRVVNTRSLEQLRAERIEDNDGHAWESHVKTKFDANIDADFTSILELTTRTKGKMQYKLLLQQRCKIKLEKQVHTVYQNGPYSDCADVTLSSAYELNECRRETLIVDNAAKTVAHQDYLHTKFPMNLVEQIFKQGSRLSPQLFVFTSIDEVNSNNLELRSEEEIDSLSLTSVFLYLRNRYNKKLTVIDSRIIGGDLPIEKDKGLLGRIKVPLEKGREIEVSEMESDVQGGIPIAIE